MAQHKRLRKILIYLLVLAVSIVILYWLADGRSLTAEMAFRRKEKLNMIGPAQIISTLNFTNSEYDHIVIGRSEYGYTFYEWSDSTGWDNGKMTYVPKEENATLHCAYRPYGSGRYRESWLPIFAFVDSTAALTAKLTLTTTQNGETIHYPLDASKDPAGYFLFSWPTAELRAEDFWLVQQLITGQYREYVLKGTAQAKLELYDAHGTLLESYQFSK